ncbi:hypothetical protein [Antarctobacter heliothermus]|uniref:Ferrochelatase n=1 Tax=Antarctobacter heliothermus TaxID=74033 RepID=A0A239D2N0_9RHOB|nr:hypothetical protein [Antarctobacter heliothermus]SNS26278.1 hypothetical protein SAMN04488078_100931 [Antarctobacter heliothermus]
MKKIVLTTALCMTMAGAAIADTKPVSKMKPDQLRKDMVVSSQSAELTATSSGASILIPLLLIVILATAASSGGGSSHYYHPYPY